MKKVSADKYLGNQISYDLKFGKNIKQKRQFRVMERQSLVKTFVQNVT